MKEIPFRHQVSRASRGPCSVSSSAVPRCSATIAELRPEHFSVADTVLAAIWRAVLEYYQHQQLPPRGHLEAKTRRNRRSSDCRAAQAVWRIFSTSLPQYRPEILAQLDAYRTWVVKAINFYAGTRGAGDGGNTTSEGDRSPILLTSSKRDGQLRNCDDRGTEASCSPEAGPR